MFTRRTYIVRRARDCDGSQDSSAIRKEVTPLADHVPSKGSLALILPTAWAPSAHKAADGHTFRSAHGPRALCTTWILREAGGGPGGGPNISMKDPDRDSEHISTRALESRG